MFLSYDTLRSLLRYLHATCTRFWLGHFVWVVMEASGLAELYYSPGSGLSEHSR